MLAATETITIHLACSDLPLATSHLGDSGMRTKPANCTAAGTPASPSMYFQPSGRTLEKAPHTQLATN